MTVRYEISGSYKNGKHHDIIFNKATFFNADGSVAGTVGTLVDITECKQAERDWHKNERFLDNIVPSKRFASSVQL